MTLDTFAYVHYKVYENSIGLFSDIADINELKSKIHARFTEAYSCNEIYYTDEPRSKSVNCSETEAKAAWFDTRLQNKESNNIWAGFVINKNQNRQKWYGIIFYDEKEMIKEFLKNNYVVMADIIFKDFNNMLDFLSLIKEQAQEEEWKYISYTDSSVNYPILKSYLEHTYARLKEEGKIIRGINNDLILFNTGLLHKDFLVDLYIKCDISNVNINDLRYEVYKNPGIVLEGESIVRSQFNSQKPQLAKYFSTIEEVIFDPELDIDLNYEHILQRKQDRIPAATKDITAKIRNNEEILKRLAKRNYKIIVPQYYCNKIQFLMPIYLGNVYEGKPDFALVLDKGDDFYRGTTILTVEMAYQNARLIARPDNPWLTSSVIKEIR